jgi:hypothetical protein
MNCNCKQELEAKLTANFEKVAPEAKNHNATLQGYGIGITDTGVIERGWMEVRATADYTSKGGITRPRTTKQNMIFSYCPFCGKAA